MDQLSLLQLHADDAFISCGKEKVGDRAIGSRGDRLFPTNNRQPVVCAAHGLSSGSNSAIRLNHHTSMVELSLRLSGEK